jgi:hypothetical protein
MKSSLLRLLALTVLPLLFVSCDDPNTADLPPQPYHFAKLIQFGGLPEFVQIKGDYVAIAGGVSGTLLYDVADLQNPTLVFKYDSTGPGLGLTPGKKVSAVALDLVHHYIATSSDDITDRSMIHDFVTGTRITGFSLNYPLRDLEMAAVEDTVRVWASDQAGGDGFVRTMLCRPDTQTPWSIDCGQDWTRWFPAGSDIRGFSTIDAEIFAIAIGEQGLHFHRGEESVSISTLPIPGVAYDCAWYGNYVVVAAQYGIDIVDATNPAHPEYVTNVVVPGADRLQHVAVQGNYACAIDINDGVYVYDIADPHAPRYLQLLPAIDPVAIDAKSDDNRIYVADRGQGVLVFTK